MFLKIDHNILNSLLFRLSVGYAAIALLFSVIAFAAFYFKLSSISLDNVDVTLHEELKEFVYTFDEDGVAGVVNEIKEEGFGENTKEVFYRLYDAQGRLLASTDMGAWGPIPFSIDRYLAGGTPGGPPLIENLDIPGRPYRDRVIAAHLGPGLIFQHGQTMKSAQHYLAIFRKLFLWVIGVSIVAAGVSGLFMARRALSGISRVTHTAQKISQGNLQERVATANQCREIRHLADTFNLMLDRIEDLIHRMQEVTENIAHDLRSPLSRIRGIAEMSLISTTQAVTPAQAAENTIEECDSLIRIINTMLDLTEIEAGVNKFDLQQVDLNQILRSACDLFETLAHEQGIEITLQMTEGVVVQSNRPQLQRLVYNLIDNAIKYTPSGGAVTIRAEAAPQHVLISVTDTGCGIPPDELPHIFDRFYRVDQSRSKPGSGLGLSLARAIAHALKGTINVTSQIEEGSCFTVALPQPA